MQGNGKGEGEENLQRYQQWLQLTQVPNITQRDHCTALGNEAVISYLSWCVGEQSNSTTKKTKTYLKTLSDWKLNNGGASMWSAWE